MLIPVYIAGFILGGLFLFAIAKRIPNRTVGIWLRAIGILSGPIFFLAVAIFSGWERERTYEMQWLTGARAAEYLGFDKHGTRVRPKQEGLVVLKRKIGENLECYDSFDSGALAHYLESLPADRVKVRYKLIYDFYVPRTYMLKSIGDFEYHPAQTGEIEIGLIVAGKKEFQDLMEICFSW